MLHKRKTIIAFIIIVFLQTLFLTYLFVEKKNDYHVDEIWQYSLANASDGYGIVLESTRSSKLRNVNQWIPNEKFNELLTVQENELFDFSHIWHNAEMDTKGPLGYVPLFLISSVTLNHFSKWQMFIVNIVSFLIIQVFLFQIAFLITRKNVLSLLVIGYYGFSLAGINTVSFLRMYAMETAITIMYVFFVCQLYKKVCQEKCVSFRNLWKDFVGVFFTIVCGALTDYLFGIIAFCCTAVTCIVMLAKKQFSVLMKYALISILGIIVFFLIFPGAFFHMTDYNTASNMWGNGLPLGFSLSTYNTILLNDFVGLDVSIYKTMTPVYFGCVLAFLLVMYGIIRFLFRKEISGKVIRKKIKDICISVAHGFSGRLYYYIMFLISIFAVIILSSLSINIYKMGYPADRYLMPVYPLIAFIIVDICYTLIDRIVFCRVSKNRLKKYGTSVAISILVVTVSVLSWSFGDFVFLREANEDDKMDLHSIADGNDVICVCDMTGDPVYLTEKSLNADSVYITSTKMYNKFGVKDKKNSDNGLYLIVSHCGLSEYKDENIVGPIYVDENEVFVSEKEILNHFKEVYDKSEINYCGETSLWSSNASVYEIRNI